MVATKRALQMIREPVGYRDYLLAVIDPTARVPTMTWMHNYDSQKTTRTARRCLWLSEQIL